VTVTIPMIMDLRSAVDLRFMAMIMAMELRSAETPQYGPGDKGSEIPNTGLR